MIGKLNYLLGITDTRPIFVIGTGRSGTHWLGYSLGNHPEIRVTVEAEPMFGCSTSMALDPSLETKLFSKLVRAYKWELFKSAPQLYLDKTHPNIWIAEKLKKVFPQSLFIGIERDPYATVSSMMKHKGVSAWHQRWREFPIPNRFLGITPGIAERYDDIPLVAQCAIRWLAHHNRMNTLRTSLGDSLIVISYESFACNTEETIAELQNFLGLQHPITVPEVKADSLNKWEKHLSDEDIKHIHDIVGTAPVRVHAD